MVKINQKINLIHNIWKGTLPYVGLHNNSNVGDEELYHIADRYIPDVDFGLDLHKFRRLLALYKFSSVQHFMVGGGSLIFSVPLLNAIERWMSLGLKPIFFGTGSGNFPKEKAIADRWKRILVGSDLLGVRGTITSDVIQDKYGITAQVVGDMGFLVNLDVQQVAKAEDYVVLGLRTIPSKSNGLNQKDKTTMKLMVEFAQKLNDQGIKIKVFSAFESVDEPVVGKWVEDLPFHCDFVPYHGDFNEVRELLRKAKALITMRMHPGIFAAAWGVPVLFLDNRAKYEDTMSVAKGQMLLTDPLQTELGELLEITMSLINEDASRRSARFDFFRQLTSQQLEFCKQISAVVK